MKIVVVTQDDGQCHLFDMDSKLKTNRERILFEVDLEDTDFVQVEQFGSRLRHDEQAIATQIRTLIDDASHQVDTNQLQAGHFATER